jgi:TRAP-type C4-dicarboxylate transport system substrate-binding protein
MADGRDPRQAWRTIYDPVLKGLGAATVTLPPAELLTALQTGVVEGFAWPAVFVTGPGFARAIKYKVTPHWWVGTDIALMNAQAFDALSPGLRNLLIDTIRTSRRRSSPITWARRRTRTRSL